MIRKESSNYSDLEFDQQDLDNIDNAAQQVDKPDAAIADLLHDAENWEFSDEEADYSKTTRLITRRSRPGYERLRVIEINDGYFDNKYEKRLKCKRTKSDDLLMVILSDDWLECPVKIDDKIHVTGEFDINTSSSQEPISNDRTIRVTAMNNLIILHPDILISVTKVADTAFCSRKALISERIRTVGEQKSKALVYGNVIHEVVQNCLNDDGDFSEKNVKKHLGTTLRIYLADLWESDLDFDASFAECIQKLVRVYNFGDTYFGDMPKVNAEIYDPRSYNDPPTLAINKVCAMEEDIWSPKYGLKGKVDATVQGSLNLKSQGVVNDVIMPLEIKTGKTTVGIEHRAQTMLYSMMIAERYDSTLPSGLLWYTTDNSITRVTPLRNELRSLILKRNTLAYHMTRKEPSKFLRKFNGHDISQDVPDIEDSILPPTIDNTHGCPRCFVVDACMLYKKAIEGPPNERECDIHQLVNEKTGHLNTRQLDFFRAWEELISIEEDDANKYRKHVWTLDGHEREAKGMCFSNMSIRQSTAPDSQVVIAPTTTYKTDFVYVFSKGDLSPLPSTQIVVGDAILISIEPDLVAMGRGFVLSMDQRNITIGLNTPFNRAIFERRSDLDGSPAHGCYRLDKDELGSGMAAVRDSLASLFYTKSNERARKLIVDLETPEYNNEDIMLDNDEKAYNGLNEDQKSAVNRVINTKDYALILGMPGTGKTTTIATAIIELVKRGKSVLLASYTHSAVDTIVRKLEDTSFNILRLGQKSKIHTDVLKFALTADEKVQSIDDLDSLFMNPPVVATTCLGVNHPLFTKRKFDYCIVDEASQITLPVCLGPIRFSEKFILVGDHYQLPPLVRNDYARKNGLDVSLFKRLCDHHPESVVSLAHQYRMAEDIMLLSNQLVYDHKLICGNDAVAKQKLELPNATKSEKSEDETWLTRVLHPEFSNRVTFLNTDEIPARETIHGDLIENFGEAALVASITEQLINHGVLENQIGVISFYRQQNRQLSTRLKKYNQVELLTADKSQGRDKDCIIVSLCRSNTTGQIGELLNDWRRINVSLTRARSKLIVVGSAITISNSDKLCKFVQLVETKGWSINIPPDALNGCVFPSMSVKSPLTASNTSPSFVNSSSQPAVTKSRSNSPLKSSKRRKTISQSPEKENKKVKKEPRY
ncbi:hypothetical protein E3Q18_01187 [Wallemia mellicola]|nr:hypothetical protein E3Q18_01187 [Wallemia mellicola]